MTVVADPSYVSGERDLLLGFVQRNLGHLDLLREQADQVVGYGPPKEPSS